MSFDSYISHTGIITIPRNKTTVQTNMIPNLEKNGITNINLYVFEENKMGCKKNNGDTTFSIKDLYNIKKDGSLKITNLQPEPTLKSKATAYRDLAKNFPANIKKDFQY